MGVEAHELMVDVWTRWQGQLVNGVFPLGRYLGCSEHSGVFLTRLETQHRREAAIKLFPADQAQEELQMPRWNRSGGLEQPHLLPLIEWGGCQLDGLRYLYVVMEYADQSLAQLLLHRALTADETREMLLPMLDALTFLHSQNLVHTGLKPANIMVVGDQLKLASDTVRRAGEANLWPHAPSVYVPPEGQDGSSSPAGDIWALGVNLFEALTRRPPSSFGEHGAVVLPRDFSPSFRDLVARCLSPSPHDRPSARELVTWAGGRSAQHPPSATIQPAALQQPEPRVPKAAPPRTVPSPKTAASAPRPPIPRAWLVVMLASVVILALAWTGIHLFTAQRTPDTAAASTAAVLPAPVSTMPTSNPDGSDLSAPPLALQEVIPDVPQRAVRTIRGHIEVSVRATVDPGGSVSAVAVDRAGPSRYFRRLAIEAAKQWKFPPLETASRRLIRIQFDFSRDGTTGRAVPLR